MLEEREAVEHLAGAAHEGLKQCELLGRESDVGRAPPDAARGGVEVEVPGAEHRRALHRPPPYESAQPGEQLGEREGLDQVVVGPGVQARDAILDGVAGREHEDG